MKLIFFPAIQEVIISYIFAYSTVPYINKLWGWGRKRKRTKKLRNAIF
jgi:hypothetical protein